MLGKDGFRKNDLLFKLKLKGLINQKIYKSERLKKRQEIIITIPKEFENFRIKKFNFRVGEIVDFGDVIVEIVNEKKVFEFESFHLGKITYINKTKAVLTEKDVLIKLMGI